MSEELTVEETRLVAAITKAVSESMLHECVFPKERRKDLNVFLDAIASEGADHETHVYVLRIGNNFKNLIKKAGQHAVWWFVMAILLVILNSAGVQINPLKWFR